jgi:hypothetical protein
MGAAIFTDNTWQKQQEVQDCKWGASAIGGAKTFYSDSKISSNDCSPLFYISYCLWPANLHFLLDHVCSLITFEQ